MAQWDEQFGPGRWRLAWRIGPVSHPWPGALALYEDAYFRRLVADPELRRTLLTGARNVYDVSVDDVESGLDYTCQRPGAQHLQDIAVRRVLVRLGIWFEGVDLVRLRRRDTNDLSPGACLDSGAVRFHRPDLIVQPVLTGWWDTDSIEAFYQSNKYLQTLSGPPLAGDGIKG
ncbi:hypothetical protein ACFYPH_06405 [Micromonospora sp. NPDC005252]|uniref:hypothetical protein n=1 Tax=Micromonospora sp. NPDC005252 TaxID=3364228 RepID=UPI00368BC48E